ncbi:MAG TPA: TMEM175 family protein [Methanosarcina sp.]|nr:TMEM175 family protein [Methanosarcina sp.]
MSSENFNVKETARTEAFSDGVFSIAITLLVLDLKDPVPKGGDLLIQDLIQQLPAFFALMTSFFTILIMWVNHHNMFNYITRIDRRFMFLNGFLLFFVTLTPYTTHLVGELIMYSNSNAVAAIYSGTFFLLGLAWNILWRHASSRHRLLGRHITDIQVQNITHAYHVGLLSYALSFFIAIFSGAASVLVILVIAVYYASNKPYD